MKIKKHDFVRRKYNREFLIDCVFFSEAERKVTIGEPFCFNFHGIFIQNEGKAKISINNEIAPLKKGSFIFLRANQVREWLMVSPDFSGYLLIFENEFIETFFKDHLFVHRFQFFQTNYPAILNCNDQFLFEQINLCKKVSIELENLQDDSHHYVRALLYSLFIQINRNYIKEYKLSTQLYKDDITLRFRKCIEENIRQKQNVQAYADLLNISRSQLNKAIQKTTGKSTSEIIRERLLTEIKSDLLYSDKTISEIVFDLGFSDTSNFVRFFKRYAGCTPSEFRSVHSK